MLKENLVKHIEKSIRENWDLSALSDYHGQSLSYGKVAERIIYLHYIFRKSHIKKGDKIALIGKNSLNWAIVYLAAITYGAVIVPILPDFSLNDMHHIVNHSDSVFLFSSNVIYEKLDETKMQNLEAIFSLTNFTLLYHKKKNAVQIIQEAETHFLDKYGHQLTLKKFSFNEIRNDELAAIFYTSGTTGFSKGVMLLHNSLMANVLYAQNHKIMKKGDNIVSFLPLAHTYGCAFEFLFPFTVGCHITFLSKIPSPKIILEAFQEIRPQLIVSVPLIIEKIYKKQIKSFLNKKTTKWLSKFPVAEKTIKQKICKKLMEIFGGNFYEVIIGGAALNQEVELFLKEIKFPFSVGYGMTECGPLISYASHEELKLFSVGQVVDTLEIKIDSDDPRNIVGEILVRGENVMYGYYKNKEATENTIDKEGWLHTGDLGLIDEEGFIYIKGRCKNMVLGPSGQNIYPEEIEAKLNNLPFVQESLVIGKDGKLLALVYPDLELADNKGIGEQELKLKMEKNRKILNQLLPSYISISKIELYPEEFEKTPTQKIKRFLYAV
ncbi:MAG: AMP-binding protein [Deltaproteobacteria bacterium]|nr:AMP-binding protein [Deltaproteobacteria bacterium]